MSGVLAQAQPAPDLTVPIAVIVVCAAIIVVTLVLQWVRARHRRPVEGDLRSGDGVPQ
ncbi:MAG TPA: hypothetical protein VIT24_11635 [Acidimicrobiales bacterium]|jgi:hypothetical protein